MEDKIVLVVDDEPINRLVLSKYLAMNEFRFEVAEDGIKAIEILKSNPNISLILLDLNMPRLDGYGVLQALNDDQELQTRELKVMVISAAMQESYYTEVNERGIDTSKVVGFMSKPVSFPRLRATLEEYIGTRT